MAYKLYYMYDASMVDNLILSAYLFVLLQIQCNLNDWLFLKVSNCVTKIYWTSDVAEWMQSSSTDRYRCQRFWWG